MEKITNELTNNFNIEIHKIVNEYNLLKDIVDNKNKIIHSLTENNNVLKTKINEMIEEKKSKSSSALWESTQLQLTEKDLIIDNLKKDIEFYKRNHKSNNVIDKYPYNGNNNKYESEIKNIIDVSKQKVNLNKVVETKVVETKVVETKVVEVLQHPNVMEKLVVKLEEPVELVEPETIVEIKVKKNKKDKSKDKSEKKKKKNKEIVKEDNDNDIDNDNNIDELEKELSCL